LSRRRRRRQSLPQDSPLNPEVRGRPFSDSPKGEDVRQGGRPSDVGSTRSVPRREFTDLSDPYGGVVSRRPSRTPTRLVSYSPRASARRMLAHVQRSLPPPASPVLTLFQKAVIARRLMTRATHPIATAKFCVQRKVRKGVLFAMKVAGQRRSPGKGGTYQRRRESAWSCGR